MGYLLYYLNAMGIRVILQTEGDPSTAGLVFDTSGVREVSTHDAWIYMDGKPCYLLVSADGRTWRFCLGFRTRRTAGIFVWAASILM